MSILKKKRFWIKAENSQHKYMLMKVTRFQQDNLFQMKTKNQI